MKSLVLFLYRALNGLCDALGIPCYCDDCGRAVKGKAPLCQDCRTDRNARAQRELCEENVDFDFDIESWEGRYGQ